MEEPLNSIKPFVFLVSVAETELIVSGNRYKLKDDSETLYPPETIQLAIPFPMSPALLLLHEILDDPDDVIFISGGLIKITETVSEPAQAYWSAK